MIETVSASVRSSGFVEQGIHRIRADPCPFRCPATLSAPLFAFALKMADGYAIEQGGQTFWTAGHFEKIWTKAQATLHNLIFSLSCRYVLCFKKALKLTCEQGRCAP